MEIMDALMNDLHEAFCGPSQFCDIIHQGHIVAMGKRLQEASYQITRGDYGNGRYLIVQRLADRTIVHEEISYPFI